MSWSGLCFISCTLIIVLWCEKASNRGRAKSVYLHEVVFASEIYCTCMEPGILSYCGTALLWVFTLFRLIYWLLFCYFKSLLDFFSLRQCVMTRLFLFSWFNTSFVWQRFLEAWFLEVSSSNKRAASNELRLYWVFCGTFHTGNTSQSMAYIQKLRLRTVQCNLSEMWTSELGYKLIILTILPLYSAVWDLTFLRCKLLKLQDIN